MTRQNPIALVVDDAGTIRKYHRDVLERHGFAVEEAMNGLEALERLLAAPRAPDLLVVDVNMPMLDGYSLVERIRREATLRAIPAILVSTEREPRDADRGFAAGANLFLVKPVRPETLGRLAQALTGQTEPRA